MLFTFLPTKISFPFFEKNSRLKSVKNNKNNNNDNNNNKVILRTAFSRLKIKENQNVLANSSFLEIVKKNIQSENFACLKPLAYFGNSLNFSKSSRVSTPGHYQ